MTGGAIAVAVGPLIGGLFTTYWSWRYVFVGEVLIIGVVLLLNRRTADTPKEEGARLDLVGTALSALGLGLVVYGILRSGTWGFVQPKPDQPQWLGLSPVIWLILGGGVVLLGFLAWEKRRRDTGQPALLDPAILRVRLLRSGLTAFFFQYLLQAGLFFAVPLFLSIALGLSAIATGVRILPLSITLVIASVGIPKVFPHASPRRVSQLGFLALFLGLVVFVALLDSGAGPEIVTWPMLLAGLGIGALASQLGAVTVSAVSDEHSGEVGGLQNTASNLGLSIGTALAGAILISALTSSFFNGIADNPAVPDHLTSKAQTELTSGVPFISDADLEAALKDAGVRGTDRDRDRRRKCTGPPRRAAHLAVRTRNHCLDRAVPQRRHPYNPTGRSANLEPRSGVVIMSKVTHLSVDERAAQGKAARERTPRTAHAGWIPSAGRGDPVGLLEDQNATREPDLVPVRHGRMMVSPFTFYRGAAKIMAADLQDTPTAGLNVQLCGDAHLSNFGLYASPERTLLFDLNDFDETLPGPFEYDVKRMAASFTIAARNNGFTEADARAATLASVTAYREAMASFAEMRTMDVWYARLSEQDLLAVIDAASRSSKSAIDKKMAQRAAKTAQKAHTRDSLQALSKLAEYVDGQYRIVSQPPIVIPARELAASYGMSADEVEQVVHDQFRAYRATLQHDRRRLLERFEVVDVARKVVGVGSVGTRAFIVLLQGRDQQDPLFLQVKEATRSVLEDHLPKSRFGQPGERVVEGQRMMQASSDIYLGWTKGAEANRFLYWRQLRDMKGSAVVETMTPAGLTLYARVCGQTLARGHARSGDPVALATYLGRRDRFDQSITDFSARYADQNDHDYRAFCEAVKSGRLEATEGV